MPYTYYYQNIQYQPSQGSRSTAQVYPGAVCPIECDFGRTHGSQPATGSISYKGLVVIPPAMEVQIVIGSAVFYGIATKVETDNDLSTGNNSKIRLVDYRDRLLDVNHFAQYNMVDDTGTWWHIMPRDWSNQLRSIVYDFQDISDFTETQSLPDYKLNLAKGKLPMYSAFALLSFFAEEYDFEFSAQSSVETKLRSSYPENLDFNSGKKVGECIDEILSKINMQWTCWGNLHIYITEKGVPSTQIERDILAGNIDLCALENYRSGTIGQEINDKSRRIRIVGGRNKTESYFPCYPDWSKQWTHGMIFNDWDLSAFYQKHNLNPLMKYSELPDAYKEYYDVNRENKVRKWNGKSRDLMTIGEYLEKIPYKSYLIDFSQPLYAFSNSYNPVTKEFLFDNPNQSYNFVLQYKDWASLPPVPPDAAYTGKDPDTGEETYGVFRYDEFIKRSPFDDMSTSLWFHDAWFPIASTLGTDTTLQFICNTTSRDLHQKGVRSADQFTQGNFAFVMDGVSLDIMEYVFTMPEPDDKSIEYYIDNYNYYKDRNWLNKPRWQVRVIFDERKFEGKATEILGADIVAHGKDIPPKTQFNFSPGQVYCRIAQEGNLFQFTLGDSEGAPRVREMIKNIGDLYQTFSMGEELAMIAKNQVAEGNIGNVKPREVAAQIAQRALNHEYITTAGHITFRTQAGFMCSGVIESVRVMFTAERGTQETINFTNIRNDDRVVSYFAPQARNTANYANEDLLKRRSLEAEAKRLRNFAGGQPGGQGGVVNARDPGSKTTIANAASNFDSNNHVMVKVGKPEGGQFADIVDGEIMLLAENPTTAAINSEPYQPPEVEEET